jgi:sugar lactone lactonase YvrE
MPLAAGGLCVVAVLLVFAVGLGTVGTAPAGAAIVSAAEPGVGSPAPATSLVTAWGSNESGQSRIPAGLSGATAVSGGWGHSLALRADGTVAAWGDNAFRQARVPAGLRGVTAISAGYNHSLALRADGTVVAWGSNHDDQLRHPDLGTVTAISAGSVHSLAVRADGTVAAWGSNWSGQASVPGGLRGVVAVAAGRYHSLALRADGTVAAWGDESQGQTAVPVGLRGVVAVAAGGQHSVALRADGTVVGWGLLGEQPAAVPAGLIGVTAIAAGHDYVLALRTDGSVVGWGQEWGGVTRVPPGVRGISGLAAGLWHVLALAETSYIPCNAAGPRAGRAARAGGWWSGEYAGDGGPAIKARLNYPKGLARAANGALIIADTLNSRIRRIGATNGEIITVAGTGARGYGGDGGPAKKAVLNLPRAVAVTSVGDVLIADTDNHRIRRIDGVTGVITTVAGTGEWGHGGDGGPATAAQFAGPEGLLVGADGTMYVADTHNARVRRIDPATGIITTVAGTGTPGDRGDGGPASAARLTLPRGLALAPDGSLYVADSGTHRVRRIDPAGVITSVAGIGQRGCTGDGGPAVSAALVAPSGLAFGPEGSLYIADASSDRIRRVAPDGRITTFAGSGSFWSSDISQPQTLIAAPEATLLIANSGRNEITAIPLPTAKPA